MGKKKKQRNTKMIGRLLLYLVNLGEISDSELIVTDGICDFIDNILDSVNN